MPGVLGLSLLVVACALGLTQLAVWGSRMEHLAGTVVVVGLALTLLVPAPPAALALLAACLGTGRLAGRAVVVPDRLPGHWA